MNRPTHFPGAAFWLHPRRLRWPASRARFAALPGTRPRHKYIDIHTHLGAFRFGQTVSVKGLLAWMDEHDVERAVILPLVSPEAAPTLQPHADQRRRARGRARLIRTGSSPSAASIRA